MVKIYSDEAAPEFLGLDDRPEKSNGKGIRAHTNVCKRAFVEQCKQARMDAYARQIEPALNKARDMAIYERDGQPPYHKVDFPDIVYAETED